MSDNNPVFDQEIIFRRGKNWEQEWTKVLYYLFETPGVLRQKVNALRWDKQFVQNRDEFVCYLCQCFYESPQSVIGSWDPKRGGLIEWIISSNSIRFRWSDYRSEELGFSISARNSHRNDEKRENTKRQMVSWDENNPEIQNYLEQHSVETPTENVSENQIFEKLKDNLNQYCIQNPHTRLTEQAALQNYQRINFSPEEGLKSILEELTSTVSALNPGESADTLIQDCHNQAQVEYQRLNDEYSDEIKASNRETRFYRKYSNKLQKNAYYRLFCPIREPSVLFYLLRLSEDNAYKLPSRYRKKFLPELLPEYRKILEGYENLKD